MRRYGLGWIAWGAFLLQGGFAMAQSSLDTLEDELKEARQQHQDVTSQVMTNFFSQIDAAMASPDAAIALYIQALPPIPTADTPPVTEHDSDSVVQDTLLRCGIPPNPVITQHESESASEKEARVALDQANLSRLGAVLQLHCGLMHYAALFVTKPDQKGLQDEWVAWLKTAAQIYPQLAVPAAISEPQPTPEQPKWKKGMQLVITPLPPFDPVDLKGKAMRDSIIGKFLGFKGWADKEQGGGAVQLSAGGASASSFDSKDPGGWAVQDLPKLYRINVLEPLRATPTAATLAAWDAYIAMANADEKDNDNWNQVVYPPLQFDRACDDYAIAPDTEKLEGLVNLIKANPTYPQVDNWIARVHKMLDDYSARHGGPAPAEPNPATAPASSAPANSPNVTVTTEQQGDATIITTHTNSAPATNAPPAH